MKRDVRVRCRCGELRGVVRDVGPRAVNRVRCHCHDCRAYAHWLGGDDLLDVRGGFDVVQVARARFEIDAGLDRLGCVRLTPEGLHRWLATCCRTPIGNSAPSFPVIGMARVALEREAEALLPAPVPFAGKSALGPGPRLRTPLRTFVHATFLYLAWRELAHPTPLFDRAGRPTVSPIVLRVEEREALRARPDA